MNIASAGGVRVVLALVRRAGHGRLAAASAAPPGSRAAGLGLELVLGAARLECGPCG